MSRDDYYAGKAIGELFGSILRIVLKLIISAILYSPILILSQFIVDKLTFLYGESGKLKWLTFAFTVYLIYCLIFMCKGIMIAFKVNDKKKVWIPLFILCVLFTCFLPSVFIYMMVFEWLDKSVFWSLLLSLIVAGITYRKYNFTVDVCPKMAFWAYSLGFGFSVGLIENPIDVDPDIGKDII